MLLLLCLFGVIGRLLLCLNIFTCLFTFHLSRNFGEINCDRCCLTLVLLTCFSEILETSEPCSHLELSLHWSLVTTTLPRRDNSLVAHLRDVTAPRVSSGHIAVTTHSHLSVTTDWLDITWSAVTDLVCSVMSCQVSVTGDTECNRDRNRQDFDQLVNCPVTGNKGFRSLDVSITDLNTKWCRNIAKHIHMLSNF